MLIPASTMPRPRCGVPANLPARPRRLRRVNLGVVLGELGRPQEELAAYEQFIDAPLGRRAVGGELLLLRRRSKLGTGTINAIAAAAEAI